MEFYNFTVSGHKVNVIYNGGIYVFHNAYSGLLCVAKRIENGESFDVTIGNRHSIGGSLTESRVKAAVTRFICKCENMYVEKDVTFNYTFRDLADDYLTIVHHERK